MKKRVLAILLTLTVTAATLLSNTEVLASEVATEVTTEVSTEAAAEATEAVSTEQNQEEPSQEQTEVSENQTEVVEETEVSTEKEESEETEVSEDQTEVVEETEVSTEKEEESEEALEASAKETDSTEDADTTEETVKLTEEEQELKLAATEGVTSGTCGDNLTWSYSNGTLTISGTGAMDDYPVYNTPNSDQCMPWYYLADSIERVDINSGVTSIGACAFWDCDRLTSVVVPASVQSIGFAAFCSCDSLVDATVNSGIIGESAFILCPALKTVTIGRGVTAVGISAFENCNALERVNISDLAAWCEIDFGGYLANPLGIAKHLYLNGSKVTELVIPNGVTRVRDYTFGGCEDLVSVSIPNGVTEIGDYAFYCCRGLRSATLPSGLKTIGASAFDSTNLASVDIPNSVSYVGSYAFAWAPIGSVNVNQGIISGGAFLGCGCIGHVTIGSGVTKIGEGAFERCAALENGTVSYGGSRSQWRALDIGEKNEMLLAASLTCTGTGSADTSTIDRNGVYVGATVKFGSYEQDSNAGADALEWTVLDVQGDKALVITQNVIDFKRYYPNLQTAVTWENSALRSWLNNEFINTAFTSNQKNNIYTTTLTNGNNPVYGIAGGANTSDKVFVLSADEVENYMPYEEDRMAACTDVAFANGATLSGGGDSALCSTDLGTSYWWLRTPGIFDYSAMYVHYTGSARYDGMGVANTIVGVRPTMWVNKNAVEVVPEEVVVPSGDPIETFVTRLYNVCLDREPDETGLNDWVNRLSSGQETGVTAAYGFIFSAEFQNKNLCNTDFVKQLYRAFMGREYDEGGLNDWVGRLQNGATREEVFNGFAMSAEFSALCEQYGITLGESIDVGQYGTVPHGACTVCGEQDGVTAFVSRLYNVCLDRNPDEAGLTDWTNQLWNHTKSGKDVSFGFIFSQEFTNKGLNDSDYVEYLYRAFFDRPSDEGGKNDWLNRMHNEGYTREDVFNGFVGSAEFENLCKRYGISRE